MSIVVDVYELDRILEGTNLDKDKLINNRVDQLDDLLHEHTGFGIGHTLDTQSTSGLEPLEGSSTVLRLGVDPCQGSSLSSPSPTDK